MTATNPQPLRVGLYGENGHQIDRELAAGRDDARLVAVAAMPNARPDDPAVRRYATLDELLADADVDLVVLCSPRRDRQAGDTRRALAAGKHVYAEKPAALSEADLDAILADAARYGRRFLEMAATAFEAPWFSLRALVQSGALGDVTQVRVQKSYPWHDRRPVDPGVDGGLFPMVGVHAFRFVEHTGGVPAAEVVAAAYTAAFAPIPGRPAMAGACILRLENGGLADVSANLLNPRGFPLWGNETVRVFGTRGMAEIVDGGARGHWYDADGGRPIPDVAAPDWLSAAFAHFAHGAPMPAPLDELLHPTRVSLRAHALAWAAF